MKLRVTNVQKLIDTDNSVLVTRRKGVGEQQRVTGKIYGDGGRFVFGWQTQNTKC